jgi:site-specific DNA recombinase
MKVLAYIRLSKDTKYEKSTSIETQQAKCNGYAQLNNWQIFHTFIDDGYSGGLDYDKRPGILNAVHNLRKEDVLLVSQMDRLGRDPGDVYRIYRLISDRGAKLISVSGEGTMSEDPIAKFQMGLSILLSENYRLEVSKKTKAALAQKKARGEKLGGKHTPYGYKLAEDGIHLEIDEREQEICRILANLHDSGVSFRKMPAVLEEMGITNRGIKWSKDTIHLKVAAYRSRNEMVHTQ